MNPELKTNVTQPANISRRELLKASLIMTGGGLLGFSGCRQTDAQSNLDRQGVLAAREIFDLSGVLRANSGSFISNTANGEGRYFIQFAPKGIFTVPRVFEDHRSSNSVLLITDIDTLKLPKLVITVALGRTGDKDPTDLQSVLPEVYDHSIPHRFETAFKGFVFESFYWDGQPIQSYSPSKLLPAT